MPFKPITETIQNLIIQMFDEGHSLYKISEELMLDRNTVYKYLLREGKVEPDPEVVENGRKRYSEEEIAEIVRMYHEGVPVAEINERSGMSIPSIYNHVNKTGKLRVTPQADLNKAIRMYKRKQDTVYNILEKTGVPRSSFYREVKKRKAKGEL